MIRTAGRGPGSRANGRFPKGARGLSEKSPGAHPPPHRPAGITWERGRPARMLFLLVVAELPRGFAGSHYVGSNHNGPTEGEPWRRSRLIQVGEMAEAVPGLVRAGRPRSQEPSSHDIVTPRAPNCRSILVPLDVEGGAPVFWSIRVHSWFVFINGGVCKMRQRDLCREWPQKAQNTKRAEP